MRSSIIPVGASVVLALALTAEAAFADCPMPAHLKEGINAGFHISSAKDGVVFGLVDKIDRVQCWVRVKSRASGGENWVNLRQVEMISTGPERQ
jgi:hypothetical protein